MKFFAAAIFLLIGGLIAFSSHATIIVDEFTYTPAQCAARPPVLQTSMPYYWDGPNNKTYVYYDGCEYYAVGYPALVTPDGYFADWYPTGRVKPSSTGSGTGGTAGTGGAGSGSGTGNGSGSGSTGGMGGGSGGSGSSGSTPSTGVGSGGTGWDSVGFPDTGGTGWGSGGISPNPGSSDSPSTNSGNSGSSSGSGSVFPNYGITSQPGSKPGETVTTFTQPLPAPVPYGEPTSQEIKNYAVDFFIYKKECGNSCLTYFDTHQPPFTPVGCMDLAFNLNVPHKKPDCRSDDIAWYDKDGRFIEFKYRLTDKARHDIINKLKGDFGTVSSGGANYFNMPLSPRGEINANYTSRLNFYDDKTPYEMLSYNNYSLMQIDKRLLILGLTTESSLNNLNDELKGFHHDFLTYYKPDNYGYPGTISIGGTGAGSGSSDGDGVLAELQSFHHDSDKYDSQLLERLNTDNLDSEANSSVSKLSTSLKGLLSGQHVGGEFEEASQLMGQIGNGSDSPLLGKFLDSKLIPIVDTRRCDMPVFGRGTEWEFTLNSVYLYKLKQILTFIMYALTFWYLFDMLTNVGGRD